MTHAWRWRLLLAAVLAMLVAPGPAAAQDGRTEIAERLRAIPGMKILDDQTPPAPYQGYFVLSYEQPVDHKRPLLGTFEQRFTLLHRAVERPMVLYTSGYDVSLAVGRSEPTWLVDGNQISVEQRFFSPSRPAPADWSKLDIWQAATDHHRLVAALKPLYGGRWLSTGASKGGMTSIYHRRFYPGDVDGTIAYVAPNDAVDTEDSAYTEFFERVGTPECRAALTALEREALGPRRSELVQRYTAAAASAGWTFDRTIGTVDRAFEMVVLDTAWAFWQSKGVSSCPSVPAATAGTSAIYSFLDDVASFGFYTDQGLARYVPYFFQAGTQLGYPGPSFDRLAGLLRYPGLYRPVSSVTQDLKDVLRFEPQRMRDIDGWVKRDGSELLFVYGGRDPWGAEPFALGKGTSDSYWYEAPAANHGADITRLSPAQRGDAIAAVQRWAGLVTPEVAGVPARAAAPRIARLDDQDQGRRRGRP